MKHAEKGAPVMAAVASLATIACCLPVGFAAAAVTASLSMALAAYQPWFPAATVFNGPVVDVTDAIEDAIGARRSGVGRDSAPSPSVEARTKELVFLTRDGCANTTAMRGRLDEALTSLGVALGYEVVDQDTLPEADVRRGYPTPTLLYRNRDAFGMPVPKPPLPDPT